MFCLFEEVQCLGVVIEKLLLDLIMVVYLILLDNCYDMLYLFNYVDQFVKDELVCINGVGQVCMFGVGEFSMCVWLDLNKFVVL